MATRVDDRHFEGSGEGTRVGERQRRRKEDRREARSRQGAGECEAKYTVLFHFHVTAGVA